MSFFTFRWYCHASRTSVWPPLLSWHKRLHRPVLWYFTDLCFIVCFKGCPKSILQLMGILASFVWNSLLDNTPQGVGIENDYVWMTRLSDQAVHLVLLRVVIFNQADLFSLAQIKNRKGVNGICYKLLFSRYLAVAIGSILTSLICFDTRPQILANPERIELIFRWKKCR